MKNQDEWDGIDGRPISMSLAHIFEMQMWRDISRFVKENPDLVRLKRMGDGIVGKVMITSTVCEEENVFRELWDDQEPKSGLYRIFIPSHFNPKEDENSNM